MEADRPCSPPSPVGPREGFAIPAVVFLLFCLTVMTATAYQLVSANAIMGRQSEEVSRAGSIAWAGLTRAHGETAVPITDTIVYTLDGGIAMVSSRRLVLLSSGRWMYLLTSTGSYGDPRSDLEPVERTVRGYAVLEHPARSIAAASVVSGTLDVDASSTVSGYDVATSSACATATGSIAGGMGVGITSSGQLNGSPSKIVVSGAAEALSRLGLSSNSWPTLLDPGLSVDYENTWPDFGALPVDSFPVVRMRGDQTSGSSRSGRGLLIVEGTFQPVNGFTWDGIVLAGDFLPDDATTFTIRGLLVTGLASTAGDIRLGLGADIRYNRCHVTAAGAGLTHFEPLPNAAWEVE